MQLAKKISIGQRIMMTMMAFILMIIGVFPHGLNGPVVAPVHAGEPTTFYIQTAVDSSSWQIAAGVVNDKKSWFGSFAEAERIGNKGLEDLVTDDRNEMFTGLMGSLPKTDGGGTKEHRVLSFPGFNTGEGVFKLTPPASSAMQDQAMFIKDRLVFDLNTAIKLVYPDITKGSNAPKSMEEFKDKVLPILSAVQNGGGVAGWQVSAVSSDTDKYKDAQHEIDSSFYREFTKDSNHFILMVSAPKYLNSMQTAERPTNSSDDTTYITWGTILYEALVNSTLEEDAVTADSVYDSTVVGVLEEAVSAMMSSLLSGLRSLLGLWEIDDLIFNKGVRGSTAYVYGIFPSSWETFIWTFFLITEILSFAIILFAIVKHIANRAAATVNPAIRANAMEQVKDMAIGVIMLVMLPGLLIAMMKISASLVNVFSSMLGEISVGEKLGHYNTGSSIAAVILGFANLVINIYFNWFYIIRQITVALLIILAPIFISWMCVGIEKRSVSVRWLMELSSNIFIQPIHAMLFAFIGLLPNTGRPVESLVMIYCLIPLTALLKGLLFPGTNDMAHGMASRAGSKASDLAKKGSMATLGAAKGLASGAIGVRRAQNLSQSGAVSSGETSGNSQPKQKNVNTNTSPSTKGDPKAATKKEARAGMGEVGVKGAGGAETGGSSGTGEGTGGVGSPLLAGGKGVQGEAAGPGKGKSGVGDKGAQEASKIKNPNGKQDNPLVGNNMDSATNNTSQVTDGVGSGAGNKDAGQTMRANFKDNLSGKLGNAKAISQAEKQEKKGLMERAKSPEGQMAMSKARMIAAAGVAGGVAGWRGQLIGSHPRSDFKFKEAQGDYERAANQKNENDQREAFRSQRSSDPNSGAATIPYQNNGDHNITSKASFAANGGSDLMTKKGPDGNTLSYNIPGYELDNQTNDLFQRATSGKAEDQATVNKLAEAGYHINKVKTPDGQDTGMYHVDVGKNNYNDTAAPTMSGDNIVHGGAYNDLVPNENRINQQHAAMPATQSTGADGYVNMAPGNAYNDHTVSSAKNLSRGGFENLQSGSDRQGNFASYDMKMSNMPQEQRDMVDKLSSNDPAYAGMREQYAKAGYTFSRKQNPDGTPGDEVHAVVRGNQFTGASAPSVNNNGEVVHGGMNEQASVNDLMPRASVVQNQAARAEAYQRVEATQQSGENFRKAAAATGSENNAAATASFFTSKPVESYDRSHSGLVVPDSVNSNGATQTITTSDMQASGVTSFHMKPDGVNSETIVDPSRTTVPAYKTAAKAMAMPVGSPERTRVEQELQGQGFTPSIVTMNDGSQQLKLTTNHSSANAVPCKVTQGVNGNNTYQFDSHSAAIAPHFSRDTEQMINQAQIPVTQSTVSTQQPAAQIVSGNQTMPQQPITQTMSGGQTMHQQSMSQPNTQTLSGGQTAYQEPQQTVVQQPATHFNAAQTISQQPSQPVIQQAPAQSFNAGQMVSQQPTTHFNAAETVSQQPSQPVIQQAPAQSFNAGQMVSQQPATHFNAAETVSQQPSQPVIQQATTTFSAGQTVRNSVPQTVIQQESSYEEPIMQTQAPAPAPQHRIYGAAPTPEPASVDIQPSKYAQTQTVTVSQQAQPVTVTQTQSSFAAQVQMNQQIETEAVAQHQMAQQRTGASNISQNPSYQGSRHGSRKTSGKQNSRQNGGSRDAFGYSGQDNNHDQFGSPKGGKGGRNRNR